MIPTEREKIVFSQNLDMDLCGASLINVVAYYHQKKLHELHRLEYDYLCFTHAWISNSLEGALILFLIEKSGENNLISFMSTQRTSAVELYKEITGRNKESLIYLKETLNLYSVLDKVITFLRNKEADYSTFNVPSEELDALNTLTHRLKTWSSKNSDYPPIHVFPTT